MSKHGCVSVKDSEGKYGGAQWPSRLWTGDRVVLGSNPAATTSLRDFGNSVYPAWPVSFEEDNKSRRSLLSGVYLRLCQGKTMKAVGPFYLVSISVYARGRQ